MRGTDDPKDAPTVHSLRNGTMVLVVLGLAACHEHVALSAPPQDASFEVRRATYEQIHPLSYHETHITYLQYGTPVGAERRTDYLQLANGKRVYYAEDILPVVPAGSPAAVAAEESGSARGTGQTLQGVAVGGYVVGGTLMLVPLLAHHDIGERIDFTPMYIGIGAIGVGLIMYFVANTFQSRANDEAATAYETYDKGLRMKLNLCGADGRGDCH